MSQHKPFSNVDAAWLRMEDSTNLMMITGVLTFDRLLDFDRLLALFAERLLRYDRFTMRIADGRSSTVRPRWETDPHFDLRAHVHRIALPQPGDDTALQELVSDMMSTPLDLSKSPWQIHLVEGCAGGCALVARLHHAIADGMALVQILLSLTDAAPDATAPQPATAPAPTGPIAALERTTQQIGTVGAAARAALRGDTEVLRQAVALGARGMAALNKLVLQSDDPQTIFKGKLGVAKRVCWSRPLALANVKQIGELTGGTINDVLVAALAGALRRYAVTRGQPTLVDIRAAVPVNLRPLDQPIQQLGNTFGVVFVELPVSVADPFDRVLVVRQRMNAIKRSLEAQVAYGILSVLGTLTPAVADLGVTLLGGKATAVMTNVPGPRQPIFLAGEQLRWLMFWVPQSGRLGIGASILSYAGEVRLGIVTDRGLIPDPETIATAFEAEIDELAALARVVWHTPEVA